MCLKEHEGGVMVEVVLQPRASRNEVAGLQGGRLKIKVTSPPVEGMANKKLCEFLADLMGIGKQRVQVIAGQAARIKRVRITDVSLDEVKRKLLMDG
jgi:uncharacterized protein (TIGR00251 family)